MFIRMAPHLARPLPIVVPTYGRAMRGKLALRAAMGIYDAVTFDRNRDIADRDRHVPGGYTLSRAQTLDAYPGLEGAGLTGAGVFCDGQMVNPPRIVLGLVSAAQERGAVAANYVEAIGFEMARGRITAVEVRDHLGGERFRLRGKVVLNATGPYAEGVVARALGTPIDPPTHWSRDAFFVVDRRLVQGERALALSARTRDPEAILSRGARHLFLVPWHGQTLVGVWHKVYQGEPDGYRLCEEELEAFIEEINEAYGGLGLTLDDVSLTNAGLIPFGENDAGAKHLKFAHRSRVIDHGVTHQVLNLITLIGVRYTTGPLDAAEAVTLAIKKLGRRAVRSRLGQTTLPGGDIQSFAGLLDEACLAHPAIAAEGMKNLLHNHGTKWRAVLDVAKADRSLAEPIGYSTTLKAEVVYAAREEMAVNLLDVVVRRTDLGTGNYPGRGAIECAADLMSASRGWTDGERQRQIDQTLAAFPAFIRERMDGVLGVARAGVAHGEATQSFQK